MRGTIIKTISGFYYVEADNSVYECKARGVFKNRGITPLVGDEAEFEPGIVTDIYPRLNFFERPPVANVELMVIVMAAAKPDPSLELLDKFLLTAGQMKTDVSICVNKCDLASEESLENFRRIYSPIYPVFFVSAADESGDFELLKAALKGKKAALAGPSGAGKSTLTNYLTGQSLSEVGEISRKSLRGRNTTRHTQLFDAGEFRIFDTPGFTSFDARLGDEAGLAGLFPEFRPCLGQCRFDDCRHLNEPDCAVREALCAGKIAESRYNSYRNLYKEITENKRYK